MIPYENNSSMFGTRHTTQGLGRQNSLIKAGRRSLLPLKAALFTEAVGILTSGYLRKSISAKPGAAERRIEPHLLSRGARG